MSGETSRVRRTILIHNPHALHAERVRAARGRETGLALLSIEHLAARLAGGFARPVSSDALLRALPAALDASLGELDAIKRLPGFQRAAAGTLRKAWLAGVNLSERARTANDEAKARCEAMARLEAEVLRHLPAGMFMPGALAARAHDRINHASELFGRVEVCGHAEMDPVWRSLLRELSRVTEVLWIAGPRFVPAWVREGGLTVITEEPTTPTVIGVSCADPRHEILEAFRWARELLAKGRARFEDITFTAAAPQAWDDHVAALEAQCGLDVHFAHGRRALETQDGQLVAALAETLLLGVSKVRVARCVDLLRFRVPRFEGVSTGWSRLLPRDAPLLDIGAWRAVLGVMNEDDSEVALLGEITETLAFGLPHAREIGERLLVGQNLALWRQALTQGPAQALDITIQTLRVPDEHAPQSSILWACASTAASAPRPFTRLLGLTSDAWPRQATEDPLLPDHVIAAAELDPLPVHRADRRDFATIRATTAQEVVCSYARRNADGRVNGISPLYPDDVPRFHCRRSRVPEHAAGETDRLFARPDEFTALPQALSAAACFQNRRRGEVTPHDGLLRPDHPLMVRALHRRQSATSLAMLVRDPLGYLWTYGFGWSAPEEAEEPLQLDPPSFGTLLHEVLERTVTDLERARSGGFASASEEALERALDQALKVVARRWEVGRPIPPPFLWRRTLQEVRAFGWAALTYAEEPLHGQRSWAELPFGGTVVERHDGEIDRNTPWDTTLTVRIPGTELPIGGVIDRLDLSEDGTIARVTDYKSGQAPKAPPTLKGGAELQRCLYAYAVRALIPNVATVQTRLLYPRALRAQREGLFSLEDAPTILEQAAAFVAEAQRLLIAGNALCGAAVDERRAFALPAGAREWYLPLKASAVAERLGSLPQLWETA